MTDEDGIRRFTLVDGTPVCLDCRAIVAWTPTRQRQRDGTLILTVIDTTGEDPGWFVLEPFDDVDHAIRQARRG